jgi:4-hydroxy-2-oxoglutarate aldolase
MRALSTHPNIIAMKNSSMHPNADYLAAIDPDIDFCLIAGNIKTFYPGISEGAVGGVLSTASWLPEYCCELYAHFINGETQKAAELHEYLNKLSSASVGKHGVSGVKMGLDLRGMHGGRPRLPLLPVPKDEVERIAQLLKEEGISKV